ncbi:Hypothetical protein, putative [Bodo saltans]|uniref:Uncharacterized protein n=1 Tax=Bodo saltans TaxID=75058 RepID=A0A0S4JLN0_BODSA|nr:Hypothetical protein, putative [Bodo saltans]|eukprot:CUG91306.1 Hypothetical protein, putative [Bodo saltans]
MSLRIYVRIEKVTDVPQSLLGTDCHVKLVLGSVIMRTRSHTVDDVYHTLQFSEIATGRLNELFVFGAKSIDHLANMKLSLQLRRHRIFLRSQKTAEAVIPLALVDPARSLKAAFPLRPIASDEGGSGGGGREGTLGNIHVRIEVELDAQPSSHLDETAANSSTNVDPREIESPTAPNGGEISPRSFSMIATSQQPPPQQAQQPQSNRTPSGTSGRRPVSAPAPKMRQSGTQTDRLFMTGADIKGLSEGISSGQTAIQGPAALGTIFSMARVGPPPAPDVVSPRRTILPVDVLAQQKVAVAHPTDDVEGLILYCEQTQRYQRELETSLAKHHLDTARSRIRALQGGRNSSSLSEWQRAATEKPVNGHTDPMNTPSLPLAEDIELERMLAIL